jgi:hypothetical protein
MQVDSAGHGLLVGKGVQHVLSQVLSSSFAPAPESGRLFAQVQDGQGDANQGGSNGAGPLPAALLRRRWAFACGAAQAALGLCLRRSHFFFLQAVRLCETFARVMNDESMTRVRRFERLALLSGDFYRTCLSCAAPQRRYKCVDVSTIEVTDAPPPRKKGEAKKSGRKRWLTPVEALRLIQSFSHDDLRRIGLRPDLSPLSATIQSRLLVRAQAALGLIGCVLPSHPAHFF